MHQTRIKDFAQGPRADHDKSEYEGPNFIFHFSFRCCTVQTNSEVVPIAIDVSGFLTKTFAFYLEMVNSKISHVDIMSVGATREANEETRLVSKNIRN